MRRFVLTLLCALALSACSGNEPPAELPFADSTTTTVPAETTTTTIDDRDPIVIENDEMISFQARWVCELQRRTFPDLSDMDTALDDALAETGLVRAAYDEFVLDMAESQAIRDEVLSVYGERCRA